MITFLYGPPACGKSHHRQQFAAMFKATAILEGWDANWRAHSRVMPQDGDLVITCDGPDQINHFCRRFGIREYAICHAPDRMDEARAMVRDYARDIPLADPHNRKQRKPYTNGQMTA